MISDLKSGLKDSIDGILEAAVGGKDGLDGVPGVVAMVTDRNGNVYEGSAGVRELGRGQRMTSDTVVNLWSTTKAVTGVAVMQLVEEGKIALDDPAKKYVPELADIQVLDGFDESGEPKLRPAKSDITVRQLLLHTAGFGYDFFNHDLIAYGAKRDVPSVATCTVKSMTIPLLFDPGTAWEYGCNIDWAGKVVENVTGKRLGNVFGERIYKPLGMNETGFTISETLKARRATTHHRDTSGKLVADPSFALPDEPEQHMGGHGLLSTVGDYMKFIRMILNDGKAPDGTAVLRPNTVALMAEHGLGEMKIKMLPGAIPQLSNDAEFFPGMPKSWGLTWMINDEDAPTGRPAGPLAWAGLANLYYWIDRKNGVGGFWATQILPFADPVSVPGYLDFETAVYRHLS
ncbi:MAG: beta-lactamase family protein [Candidatus Eremiobacteraeota bacterium]|nr:beta-lactamase family protein [Candidatus Eremiobacteraeota bacterium]